MDPINEIELEDCPVCRGAGYIEDEQLVHVCVLPELRHGDRPRQLQDAGGAAGAARQAAYLWNIGKVIHNGMCD